MTDRELLELAAKVAEIVGEYVTNYGSGDYYYTGNQEGILYELPQGGMHVWNPLTNDGDALRLVVKRQIDVLFWPDNHVTCVYPEETMNNPDIAETFGSNLYAATRRAIVRAAAEIGKEMK